MVCINIFALHGTYVFLNQDEFCNIERSAFSFGLSFALVPLAVFFLNYLLGMKIILINCIIIVFILILIPISWLGLKKRKPTM